MVHIKIGNLQHTREMITFDWIGLIQCEGSKPEDKNGFDQAMPIQSLSDNNEGNSAGDEKRR